MRVFPRLLVSCKAGLSSPHLWERRPRSLLAPGCSTGPGRERHCGAAPARSHSSQQSRRRRLRPLPCPLPGPRGLRAAAWDSSRPGGCGCSRRPPQRPRRRHGPRGLAASARAGCRMPVDAHLLPEFLLPGPAQGAGENVRGRGGTRGLRVSEAPWPPSSLLLAQETPRGRLQWGRSVLPGAPRALLLRHVAPTQVLLRAPLWTPQAPRGSPAEHPAGPTTPGAHAQMPRELESS